MGSNTDQKETFEKPYFISYVSISAFSVCLLGFLQSSWRRTLNNQPRDPDGFVPLRTIPAGDDDFETDLTEPVSDSLSDADNDGVVRYSAQRVLRIAFVIAPLFFLSDWIYTLGLEMSTVASSSTISSLTGLFTLAIGAYSNVERFSIAKLFAAIGTIIGVGVISAYDGKEEGRMSVIGDAVNLLAAIVYSIYTTVLKQKSGLPGALDVSMLFGMIGAVTLFGGIPGFVILHFIGWETFQLPPRNTALVLLVNAFIGTVASDFLWAKSIVLTTPMIGTLALSLTLPLSIILDYFFRGRTFSLPYLIGVTLVFAGFIVVNADEMLERNRTQREEQRAGSDDGRE